MSREKVILCTETPIALGIAYLLIFTWLHFGRDPTRVGITGFLDWNHPTHSGIHSINISGVPGPVLGTGVMEVSQAGILPAKTSQAREGGRHTPRQGRGGSGSGSIEEEVSLEEPGGLHRGGAILIGD